MMIHIEPYQATFDAIEKRLTEMEKKDEMNGVLKKAVNEVAKRAKERLHEETTAYYTIKSEVFKKNDIRKRANNSSRIPSAKITLKGPTIGIKTGYETRDNEGRKPAGAWVIRKSAMKDLQYTSDGHTYKAFVAKMKTGHMGIFQRVAGKYMEKYPRVDGERKGREKIKELHTLSKAQAAGMVYERKNMYTELQSELTYSMLKHMNAAIGGKKRGGGKK